MLERENEFIEQIYFRDIENYFLKDENQEIFYLNSRNKINFLSRIFSERLFLNVDLH